MADIPSCDTPPSWLELEQLHLGELPASVAADVRRRLADDPAAQARLREIEAPVVLRPLPSQSSEAPEASEARERAPGSWRRWRWPVLGLAGAAMAGAMVLVRTPESSGPSAQHGPAYIGVKGDDVFTLALVAQRGGQVVDVGEQAFTHDRLKVVLTCTPPERRKVQLVVFQDGQASFPIDGRPEVQCGNRVPVPGAFRLSAGAAWICGTPAGSGGSRGGAALRARLKAEGRVGLPPGAHCVEVEILD